MAEESSRLERVRERGSLACAIGSDVPGFGFLDEGGNNVGFDLDLCRAVAAAVLGDPSAVEFRIVDPAERGPILQAGEIDMLSTVTTWTSSRDSQWGNFTQTMFYDGQGFMVPRSLGVNSALELKDANVCVTQGTTTELNLQDFSNEAGLDITAVTFEDSEAALEAYKSGQCDAFTTDRSALSSLLDTFPDPDAHLILPDTISEEPLGPVVPHGDEQWYDIAKTVMAILIYAEAYGIGMNEVPTEVTGKSVVDRLFGLAGVLLPRDNGPEPDGGAGRDPGRGQLRRNLRPQPGAAGDTAAARGWAQCTLGRCPLPGLPQGRPDLRRAAAVKDAAPHPLPRWQREIRKPSNQSQGMCKVIQAARMLVLSLSKDRMSESVHGSTGSPTANSQGLCACPANGVQDGLTTSCGMVDWGDLPADCV